MKNALDKLIETLDRGVKTVFIPAVAQRESPAAAVENPAELGDDEARAAAALMRVNHCGEVCAQALYQGQSLFARDSEIASALQEAADEEIDHLAWTAERIRELGGRKSLLTPLWFGGAFAIGALAALASDKKSLGFVAETERQVGAHLRGHLEKLPPADQKSRAVVAQMEIDETKHATSAIEMGGEELPEPAKQIMRAAGKVMTTVSYWV